MSLMYKNMSVVTNLWFSITICPIWLKIKNQIIMKKSILITVVMFFLTINLAQAQSTGWSNWTSIDCFKGVQFRVKSQKTSSGKYEAYLEFKNNYNENIHFNYEISGGSYSSRNNRVSVRAGSTYKSYAGTSFTSNYFNVYVDRLRFGRDGLQPYADCDK